MVLADVDVRTGLDGDQLTVDLEDNVVDLLAAQTVSSSDPCAGDTMGRVRTWGRRRRTSRRRRECRSTITWWPVGVGGEHGDGGGVIGRDREEET